MLPLEGFRLLTNAKPRLSLLPVAILSLHAAAGQLLVPSQFSSIQAAVDAAAPGDEIIVAAGDYQGDLVINKPVTVRGRDGAARTRIIGSGSGPAACVIADGAGGTLTGFTISNGVGQNGGGLFLSGDVAVIDCVVTGNAAMNGGGAFVVGSPLLSDVRFEGNAAQFGGGVFLAPDSNALLDLCDFLGNTADDGGAVYISPRGAQSTYATIGAGAFENNDAENGAGVYARMSGFEIVDASFSNNSCSDRGGAIFAADIEFSTLGSPEIEGNEADFGAAVYLEGASELRLQDALINANISGDSSAAVQVMGGLLSMQGSNLWGNSPESLAGAWNDLGENEFSAPQLCAIDFAAPYGVLDIQDVMSFIEFFMASDARADLAPPSGMHDLMDILSFISDYYSGCAH